jgi:GH24 family phage-related lysozyme (muramidase)
LIRDFEGFRETPYWDVNAYRTGYGSDPITTADGQVVPVTQGARVTREDAERDLLRRVNSEFMPSARSAVGPEVFDAMDPNQQAALVSLAYNYGANAWGDDLAGVAAAARSGDPAATAQAIRALGSHNGGINANRRAREAALFTGSGQPAPAGPAPTMSAQGQPPASMELAMRLAQLAGNPALDPGRRAMVNALLGQTMQAMQPQSEAERLDLELKRLELDRARNPQPEFNVLTDEQEAALGLPTEGTYQRGADGRITAIGGGGTNVTVEGARTESEYDKARGKQLAEAMAEIETQEGAALRAQAALDVMEQAAADPRFYSGAGAEMNLTLRRAAAAIGLGDPESVASMEVFNAQAKQAALDVMGGSLGTGFSNADRDFVLDQVPNLGNTREGNMALIEVQRRLQARKVEVAQMARQWEQENGTLSGFQGFLGEWSAQNPVFEPEFMQQITGIAQSAPAAPASPAPASPAAGQPAPAAPASIPEADARRALQGLVMSPNFDLTAWEQMPLEAQQRAIRRWLEQNP